MTRTGTRRPKERSPHSKKQKVILEVLEDAARRAGLTVSIGRLRYAGLKLKGGSCLLRGRRWLIMDRTQPFEDLLEIFRQVLTPEELAEAGLSRDGLSLVRPKRAAKAEASESEEAQAEESEFGEAEAGEAQAEESEFGEAEAGEAQAEEAEFGEAQAGETQAE
jgi:hypothetical protein